MRKRWFTLILILSQFTSQAMSILIPMDGSQANHLKAYGIIYSALQKDTPVEWLLNYRGGSFLIPYSSSLEGECKIHGVTTELLTDSKTQSILSGITKPEVNMNVVRLERAARIVVYSPKNDIILEPSNSRKFSDINSSNGRPNFNEPMNSYFRLFDFSAKWDIIASMLIQNHDPVIHEFFGQTSTFNKFLIKPRVLVLGENTEENKVRYIHDEFGKGFWTFYSGHDPEGSPGPRKISDLNLYPHSPGYRLILNNVLFPSAKKKKQKT